MSNEDEEGHKYLPNQEVESQTQCVCLNNEKRIHCEKLYLPVAGWPSVRILLILVTLEGWKIKRVDCVKAFPQAHI